MSDDDDENQTPDFSPTAFMRARRPYLYSDTEKVQASDLTREVLSHHLETLTKQKDETRFEHFAQRLAQKFISPNIRPQTGPTAGGDGKSDAETYPVTAEIAERWFVGNPSDFSERMAFAFSAEKAWKPKVRGDVKGLADTARPYRRIYFVSNQYVPARESAEVQDELEKAYGIPVTILDRTWLLDRVLNDDSIDIALDTLGVTGATEKLLEVPGPKDYERKLELDEIEARLALGGNYPGSPHSLIEDAHRAAILTRGLGRPQWEVDGKFQRALRLAKTRGGGKQQLAIVYDQAWTVNFWFDDFEELAGLYDEVEKLAIDSDDADDLERLTNLLPLLRTAVAFKKLEPSQAKIEERVARLRARFKHGSNLGGNIPAYWVTSQWQSTVNDELRIAITRGARISNPHAYGVSIGSNMSKLPSSEGEIVEFTTRNHILTPTTSANLERFLSTYAEHGRYLLVPAKFNGVTVAPEPNLDLAIGKHELVVRQGWEIGMNDPDVSILDEDDPPVVPMDVSDPPALKALEWLAKMSKR